MPGEVSAVVSTSENVIAAAPDWEVSKENVKPLKAGRKLKGLRLHPMGETTAAVAAEEGGGGAAMTVQQRLEAEER